MVEDSNNIVMDGEQATDECITFADNSPGIAARIAVFEHAL